MVHPYGIALIVLLLIVVCLLIWFIWYIYKLEQPSPGNCSYLKVSQPDIKWSSDCSYIEELVPDDSIKTPTLPMYLSKFTSSPSLGPAWGASVWYRYRYVNSKTGGYGKFSPWTLSPITSGSSNLPCQLGPGKCSGMESSGKDSCTSNLATLTVNNLDYPVGSDIYVNVHRYATLAAEVTPPLATSPDKIVGMVIPTGNLSNVNPSGTFIDISDSPCKEIECSNIQGC